MIHRDFLDPDFRKNRDPKRGLPSTDSLTIRKHEILLPRSVVEGKRVLDLGSFIGATGDWCLKNGAKEYVGVEISAEFNNIAKQALTKHHPGQNWTCINQGFDQFFADNTDKFDIVFAWGVVHHTFDHVWFLRNLALRGDHVIVAARPPKVMWRGQADSISDEFLKQLEYDIPYTEYHNGEMSLMYKPGISIQCTSANSSLAAVKTIMGLEGFGADLTAHEQFKQLQPNDFGIFKDFDHPGMYVINFYRNQIKQYNTYEEFHYNTELFQNQTTSIWGK